MSQRKIECLGKCTVQEYERFKIEWKAVCLRLLATGKDLSKIKLKKKARL